MNPRFAKLATAITCAAAAMTGALKTASADTLYYNPVVDVVGSGGTVALTSSGFPVAIDVFQNSTSGQLAPTSSAAFASSSGTNLVDSGNSSSEGALSNNPLVTMMAALGQSYTGSAAYVYNVGYNVPAGSAAVAASTTDPTAAGQTSVTGGVASNPQILLTQSRSANYSGVSIRGAGGADDTANPTLYAAGAAGSWRNYTTSTQVGAPSNVRTVQETYASNGTAQLFGSSDTGSTVGISVINPSTSTSSLLVQSATASSLASPYAFVLFDNTANSATIDGYNTAYIADDGTGSSEAAGNAGIEKWTFNGSVWMKDYTLLGMLPTGSNATGYRGLAGQMDGAGSGDVILYATDASSAYLQQVIDPVAALTNPGDTFTTLATAPTNEVFRGVGLAPVAPVPEPNTIALLAAGACGLYCIIRRRRKK